MLDLIPHDSLCKTDHFSEVCHDAPDINLKINKYMTDTAKTTLWVIIILVLVGVIWWFVGSNPDQQTLPPQQASVQQLGDVQPATTTEVQIEDASTSISVQDKTDATLNEDLNKVDEQLKLLATDSTN